MEYNPFLPEVRENPYPYYAYLRQHAPVHQVKDMGYWVITRYDDVFSALRNPQVFSSSFFMAALMGEFSPFLAEVPLMIGCDPPNHTRLRKLVNRAFTPRRIASLEAHLHKMVHSLLDQAAAEGAFDLTRDLAIPVPVMAIAELLGVPPERYRDFRRWTACVIQGTNGGTALPPEMRAEIRQSTDELHAYFRAAIAAYRQKPGDNLISDLVRAEEENQVLTADEVMNMVLLVMFGGSETTTNLIGNMMLALLDNPDQLAAVRANPSLAPQVVEEAVRYDAPVQGLFRQTTQDVELSATKIPAGSVVQLMFGSASRDERKFSDPDRFDILRNSDGHVSFGFGIHFCLGAQLARLEAKVALEGLLQRFARISRTDAQITRLESIALRGPKALPLMVG